MKNILSYKIWQFIALNKAYPSRSKLRCSLRNFCQHTNPTRIGVISNICQTSILAWAERQLHTQKPSLQVVPFTDDEILSTWDFRHCIHQQLACITTKLMGWVWRKESSQTNDEITLLASSGRESLLICASCQDPYEPKVVVLWV